MLLEVIINTIFMVCMLFIIYIMSCYYTISVNKEVIVDYNSLYDVILTTVVVVSLLIVVVSIGVFFVISSDIYFSIMGITSLVMLILSSLSTEILICIPVLNRNKYKKEEFHIKPL